MGVPRPLHAGVTTTMAKQYPRRGLNPHLPLHSDVQRTPEYPQYFRKRDGGALPLDYAGVTKLASTFYPRWGSNSHLPQRFNMRVSLPLDHAGVRVPERLSEIHICVRSFVSASPHVRAGRGLRTRVYEYNNEVQFAIQPSIITQFSIFQNVLAPNQATSSGRDFDPLLSQLQMLHIQMEDCGVSEG